MVPMCVTLVVSPIGSSTTVYVIAVMVVNNFTEQVIWSVALVSKTHVLELWALLFITLVGKTECWKFGSTKQEEKDILPATKLEGKEGTTTFFSMWSFFPWAARKEFIDNGWLWAQIKAKSWWNWSGVQDKDG